MTETLTNGYSFESIQRELSNEYQQDRIWMGFRTFRIFLPCTKVASAWKGLRGLKIPEQFVLRESVGLGQVGGSRARQERVWVASLSLAATCYTIGASGGRWPRCHRCPRPLLFIPTPTITTGLSRTCSYRTASQRAGSGWPVVSNINLITPAIIIFTVNIIIITVISHTIIIIIRARNPWNIFVILKSLPSLPRSKKKQ